jgi:hypothetical protein
MVHLGSWDLLLVLAMKQETLLVQFGVAGHSIFAATAKSSRILICEWDTSEKRGFFKGPMAINGGTSARMSI